MDKQLVLDALAFYEGYPDGQYDHDVVVPILREWLAMAELADDFWRSLPPTRKWLWEDPKAHYVKSLQKETPG